MDLLEVAMEMAAGFDVNGEAIGTGFSEGFGISFGFFDHKMDIADLIGRRADLFDDGEPEADVGNESSVHDIEVEPVGIAFVEHPAFFFEAEKIRGQQRGGYNGHELAFLTGLKIGNMRLSAPVETRAGPAGGDCGVGVLIAVF